MAQLAVSLELGRSIDRGGELPVGVQLLWRMRTLIQGGALSPGEKLPSVRELAQLCEVNVNTVRAVYSRLESQGLVTTRQGAGSFVADDVRSQPELERLAAEAVADAQAAGVDPLELASAIYLAAPAPGDAAPARSLLDPAVGVGEEESLAARSELRRQISRLEARLAAYADPAASQAVVPTPAPQRPAPMPRIASMAELEATRDQLLDELKRAGAEVERQGRRARKARRRIEQMAAQPERHKWEWVSSEETGDRGCKEWRVVPRFGPVGAAMGWWRIKVSGGCPLAARLGAASAPNGQSRRR